jgi:hypothetical protein
LGLVSGGRLPELGKQIDVSAMKTVECADDEEQPAGRRREPAFGVAGTAIEDAARDHPGCAAIRHR